MPMKLSWEAPAPLPPRGRRIPRKPKPSPSKTSKTLTADPSPSPKPLKEEASSESDPSKKSEILETPKEEANSSKKTLPLSKNPPKKEDGPSSKDSLIELKKKGSDFDPRRAATWKTGDPVPFLFLARSLEPISAESDRIAIIDILANVFLTIIATTPKDLPAVYLSANRIALPHEGTELGIGDASLIKALAEAYGRKEDKVKEQLTELDDPSLVAKAIR